MNQKNTFDFRNSRAFFTILLFFTSQAIYYCVIILNDIIYNIDSSHLRSRCRRRSNLIIKWFFWLLLCLLIHLIFSWLYLHIFICSRVLKSVWRLYFSYFFKAFKFLLCHWFSLVVFICCLGGFICWSFKNRTLPCSGAEEQL